MSLRKGSFVVGAVVALVLMTFVGPIQVGAQVASSASHTLPGSIQRGFIEIGGSPGVPAVNPRTETLYVPIQCPTSYCSTTSLSHVMDVINAATCNATDTSGCYVVARAKVGGDPLAAAVDEKTDTIYTANATGTISVVDGALCNAAVTSGCNTPLATIHTGGFPVDDVFNPRTRTLYVVSPAGDVFVINGAHCNATTTEGCGQPVKVIQDASGPQAVDVDLATDTVYAVNNGGSGNTVSMIDGATCNGGTGSGCGLAPRTITVGNGAFWDAVDQNTDTIYVANLNDSTVSVINGARCNATNTSGCATTPPTVQAGAGAEYVAVDDSLHTVFDLNQNDDTLSAINTRTCQGTVTAGCSKTPPSVEAGSNHNPGYTGFPNTMTLLPDSATAYVVNVGGENRVSVITVGRCNAVNTSGCRALAPSVPNSDFLASVDPSTDTIYAGSLSQPDIDVINGATCDAKRHSGCAPVAEIPMADPQANVGSIDRRTHTLYASDPYSDTVSVINIAHCNATDTAGCDHVAPTMTIGPAPGPPVLNPSTGALYIPFGSTGNEIAVTNAATCNATDTVGCGQLPGVITVGVNTFAIAVSAKTNTIYAPSGGNPFASGDTMFVVNGTSCNGIDHSGCGHIAATVKVGFGPTDVAVNDSTNTVYVANNANGDNPGTLSVINGATCNGTVTTGCDGHIPSVAIGRSAQLVAIDLRTDFVYITDFSSAGVSVVDGTTCNAMDARGCRTPAPEQATGSQPIGIAVNPDTDTVYALNLFGGGSMSIFAGSR
ncbi:MAG: YncE family protein [Candidatus Dormiibacterota bacterium]